MYQTVGHRGIGMFAAAMDLPLFRREIEGSSVSTASIDYCETEGDEVEDLFALLKQVKVGAKTFISTCLLYIYFLLLLYT